MITIEQAKKLKPGSILVHETDKDSNGGFTQWKVIGPVKTKDGCPDRVRVPVKHGLFVVNLTEDDLCHINILKNT